MAKYKTGKTDEKVEEVRVLWANEGRDAKLFPKFTILSDQNAEAVLMLMHLGNGKDVLDVKFKTVEKPKSEQQE